MNIHFFLDTLGWMTLLVNDGNKDRARISHSSDYGDKFQELINHVMFLREILASGESAYLPYESSTDWCDDIINYNISFILEDFTSPIKFKVVETPIQNPNQSKLIVDCLVNSTDLFSQLYNSLQDMISDFGLIGYKKNWEVGNFPIADYLILKSNAINFKINCDNDWKAKVKIEDEIALLNK